MLKRLRQSSFVRAAAPTVFLFAFTAAMFLYVQWAPTFPDPDSFYHAKVAQQLYHHGTFERFPYLSATVLSDRFVDHQFLYHVLLAPFVELGGLAGVKLFSVLFAAATVVGLYWFMKQNGVRGALWYALFCATVNPFLFRINLAKTQPLVLLLLFLALYLMFRRRYLVLVPVSAAYVWLYGGWPILPAMACLYVAVSVIYLFWRGRFFVNKQKQILQSLRLLVSVAVGTACGLVFHPYFPENMWFYWIQSFQIAIVNYQDVVAVGGEWYPFAPKDLFGSATTVFLLLTVAMGVFVARRKNQSAQNWFMLVATAVFLVFTFKSRRYVEYFIPFAVVFSAMTLSVSFSAPLLQRYRTYIPRWLAGIFVSVVFIIVGSRAVLDVAGVKKDFDRGIPFWRYYAESRWLADHTTPGEVIFHSDWDEFPMLYHHNDQNYYIVGLDPTFMYFSDPARYHVWASITLGNTTQNLRETIKHDFDARYVFVDRANEQFMRNLSGNVYFEKVYEGPDAVIFTIH